MSKIRETHVDDDAGYPLVEGLSVFQLDPPPEEAWADELWSEEIEGVRARCLENAVQSEYDLGQIEQGPASRTELAGATWTVKAEASLPRYIGDVCPGLVWLYDPPGDPRKVIRLAASAVIAPRPMEGGPTSQRMKLLIWYVGREISYHIDASGRLCVHSFADWMFLRWVFHHRPGEQDHGDAMRSEMATIEAERTEELAELLKDIRGDSRVQALGPVGPDDAARATLALGHDPPPRGPTAGGWAGDFVPLN